MYIPSTITTTMTMAKYQPNSKDENNIESPTTAPKKTAVNKTPQARPAHLKAHVSSYAGHTQASIARQTEKSGLVPPRLLASRAVPVVDSREPATPSSTPQTFTIDPRNEDNTSSSQHERRIHDKSEQTSSLSNEKTQNQDGSSRDTSIPDSVGWLGSQVDSDSQEASPVDSMSDFDSEIAALQKEIEEMERDETLQSDQCTGGSGDVIDQAIEYSDMVHVLQDGEKDTAEGHESEVHIIHMDEDQLGRTAKHAGNTESGSLNHRQLAVIIPDYAEGPVSKELSNNPISPFKKLEDRMKTAAKLNQDMLKARELENAREDLQLSNDMLKTMQQDVEQLANAVKQSLERTRHGAPDTRILKNLKWHDNPTPETLKLHSEVLKLTEKMESEAKTFWAEYMQVKWALSDQKPQLAKAKKELQAEIQAKQALLQVNSELEKRFEGMQDQLNLLQSCYQNECKKRKQAERKYTDFKKIAEAMYQPDLEQRNRELHHDLMTVRDEYNRLQERAQTHQTRARRWESEYKTIKSRAERQSKGMEFEIKQKEDEMLLYIKDYHDKVKDPAHWNIESLQKTIRTLERDRQVTNEAFDREKREKTQLEETEIPRLWEKIDEFEEENKKLKDGWANMHLPWARAVGSTISNSTILDKHNVDISSLATSYHHGTYVPRFMHPDETAKREAEVQRLREEQERRRASAQDSAAIMGQISTRNSGVGDRLQSE